MDKDKVEIPHQANPPGKDKSKFDWVTERSNCSLPKIFQALRAQVEEDIKTRNGLRPANAPYKFSVEVNGTDFSAVLVAGDVRSSVVFALSDHAIAVRTNDGRQKFEVTLNFTPEGKCQLIVNGQPNELWQVRCMALEDLLFHSN